MLSERVLAFPGLRVHVSTDCHEFMEMLESLLVLEEGGTGDLDVEVRKSGSGYRVRLGEAVDCSAPDATAALLGFYGHLYEYYVPRSSYFLVHAGAVVMGDAEAEAILLPGEQRSGKTTLTALLAAQGKAVLTDDVGVVDPAACAIWPYPRHLLVRGESLRRHASIAQQLELIRELDVYGEVVSVARPRARAARRPFTLSFIAFPSWSTERSHCRALTAAEAAVGLMDMSLNLRFLGAGGVRMAATIARGVPAYRLEVREAMDGIQMLEDLHAARATARAGRSTVCV